MILLLDNHDSFVHNLARYFRLQGRSTRVIRSNLVDASTIDAMQPQAIVLSPGPRRPEDAGCCLETVRQLGQRIPILGVCLGHQVIGQAFGGQIVPCPPKHGRVDSINHNGRELFQGIETPMDVARYHSLAIASSGLPDELQVTARSLDGTIMAICHRRWPVYGVQFHPESILSGSGMQMIGNFCRLAVQQPKPVIT